MTPSSNAHWCNMCLKGISTPEQVIAHLVSTLHGKEKAKLENCLKHSWNSTKDKHGIPSLLGNWEADWRHDDDTTGGNLI